MTHNTIEDNILWAQEQFQDSPIYFGHGTDNALDEAAWLVLHALGKPLDLPFESWQQATTADEQSQIRDIILRRINERVPAAYLTGEAWFYGLPFTVNEHVLIPRSPVAELIANDMKPWLDLQSIGSSLDLCTGSGCIGIAMAVAAPTLQVTLAELSEKALEVANANIERHQLTARVSAVQSDLYQNLAGQTFDLIITNPPYVGDNEMQTLPEEYRHEPSLALRADNNGLALVNGIIQHALDYLNPNGVLVVEVGNSQEALMDAMPDHPFTWLEFAHGGHGVFVLTYEQLQTMKHKGASKN